MPPWKGGAKVAVAAGHALQTIGDLGSALFMAVVDIYEPGAKVGSGYEDAECAHADAEAAVGALADAVANLIV